MLPSSGYNPSALQRLPGVRYAASLAPARIPSDPTHIKLLRGNFRDLLGQAWGRPALPPSFLESFQWAKRSELWTSHWLLRAQHPDQPQMNCQLLVTNKGFEQHPVLLSAEVFPCSAGRANVQPVLDILGFHNAALQWVRSLHALHELVKEPGGAPSLGEVQALFRHPSYAMLQQPVPLPVVLPSSTPNLLSVPAVPTSATAPHSLQLLA